MGDIAGYIFPISLSHANSIFEKKKNVFGKFGKRLKKLSPKAKALFYVSGTKSIIGEARIKSVETMTPEKAWEKYGVYFFLTKEELNQYSKRSPIGNLRKTRELSIYVLERIKKYNNPIPTKRRMTPAGYYITNVEYIDLKKT